MKLKLTMLVGVAATLVSILSSCSQETVTLSFDGFMTIDVHGTYKGKIDVSYTDNDGQTKKATAQSLPFTRIMQYEKSVKKVTVTVSPTPGSMGSKDEFVEAELIGATRTHASKKEFATTNKTFATMTLEHSL